MKRIYTPTVKAQDWQRLLARPDRHWKAGFSAMSVAQSWEAAGGALPREIADLLKTSTDSGLHGSELLLAIPEYQVELRGGSRPTQTDVFALVRTATNLAALAVEGKVDEPFGPTVEAKRAEGADDRLAFLHELLELDAKTTASLRYQLLHRTAAAIILAERFRADSALLVVQSFSPGDRWIEEFEHFSSALGVNAPKGQLARVGERGGKTLYLGWVCGDQRFRSDLSGSAVGVSSNVFQ